MDFNFFDIGLFVKSVDRAISVIGYSLNDVCEEELVMFYVSMSSSFSCKETYFLYDFFDSYDWDVEDIVDLIDNEYIDRIILKKE